MITKQKVAPRSTTGPDVSANLLKQYGCGPVEFTGTGNALYERHLLFDNVVSPDAAGARERFEACARSVRDVLSQRWLLTEATYERDKEQPRKRVQNAYPCMSLCTSRQRYIQRGCQKKN